MQISPTEPDPVPPDARRRLQADAQVRVRGERWRIVDVRPYDDCELVTLAGEHVRHFLAPFDTIEAVDRHRRPRSVGARLWRRACRTLIAGATPPGGLRAVRRARIELMPHQLEPALAILRGLGCRLLLADDVGLGKTIQAGIAIVELHARGCAERVLVLAPSGLREQWAHELTARFALDAHIADAATLRRRAAMLPVGVNPWLAERVVVASIDYVKRSEVLPAVAAIPWDIVVVDEAHGTAGDTDRRLAVHTLASRASYVLLLTATPHSGDRQSFATLCGLGAVDDSSLLVFRRARSDVRQGARRRVHALHVRPSGAEGRMHMLLARYTAAISAEHRDTCLAASVLHKRALSSPWSLAQSVARRLDVLARTAAAGDGEQLALPLADPDGELTRADEPPAWPADLRLADTSREMGLLQDLLSAARSAAGHETKTGAVRRLLRRSKEPAIVFTEYRDTLQHLQVMLGHPAVVLHGGLTREERASALEAFSTGRQTVLLATDAAGEGLNLHRACRLVINLELPWNPMRLEQRIGRVDRIGQTRTVHAVHLVAANTGETRILARLKDRIARARGDVGAPDPIGDAGADQERAVAQLVMFGARDQAPTVRLKPDTTEESVRLTAFAEASAVKKPDTTAEPVCLKPDLRIEAAAEADRLKLSRRLTSEDDAALSLPDIDGPLILRARRWRLRASLQQRAMLVWRVSYEDGYGRSVESTLVPVAVDVGRWPVDNSRAEVERFLQRVEGNVVSLIEASTTNWRETVERTNGAFVAARAMRTRAIAAHVSSPPPAAFQPGLFDRRAERERLLAAASGQLAEEDFVARLNLVPASARLAPSAPRLLLVLVS